MSAVRQFEVAMQLVKLASGPGNELAAGASGLFGPLGAYLYARHAFPNNEHARSDLVARTAIGGSLGGLFGSAAGIPISMSTGIPILPGVALSALLGAAGGSAGAAWGSHRHEINHDKYEKSKKLRQRRDPDNIESNEPAA